MKKLIVLLALIVSLGGCTFLRDLWDRAEEYLPEPTPTPAATPIPEPTVEPPAPTPTPAKTPAPPVVHWRDGYDVATYPVSGGSFQFWTRNIRRPTQPNHRGMYEYILVRIHGRSLKRLLLMSMYDRRPRIFVERTNNTYSIIDGRFEQPLPGPSRWRIAADGRRIWIELDGREIWSESGNYTVETAVMGGYASPPRGFLGQWSVHPNPSSAAVPFGGAWRIR